MRNYLVTIRNNEDQVGFAGLCKASSARFAIGWAQSVAARNGWDASNITAEYVDSGYITRKEKQR